MDSTKFRNYILGTIFYRYLRSAPRTTCRKS
ncbi:hypothetical protein [Bifidobacterium longum]|nr:hypothetical protein [Bifidobacterium longum]